MRPKRSSRYIYDLNEPIDEAVFQRIDDYAEVVDMASAPISKRQKIDLAMLIIIKSKRFNMDIRAWNTRPLVDKTWDNFKDSFRNAYDVLRDLGDLTVQESPMLSQAQLMETIMHAIQQSSDLEEAIMDPLPPVISVISQNPPTQQQQAKNAFQNTLMKKFEELTTELALIKRGMGNNRNTRGRQVREPKRDRWSCGCCPHWGKDCTDKMPGHKDDATFRDRKGGSNENCRPSK